MLEQRRDAYWLRLFFYGLFAVLVAFGAAYLLSVQQRGDLLRERYLRELRGTAENLYDSLSLLNTNLENALGEAESGLQTSEEKAAALDFLGIVAPDTLR